MLKYLIIGACLTATGCSDTLRVVAGDPTDEQYEALLDAEERLGVALELVDDPRGAVVINWVASPFETTEFGTVAGVAHESTECYRSISAIPTGFVVAHELGHALGLEHNDDKTDLMSDEYYPLPEYFGEQGEFASRVEHLNRRCR